MLTLGMLTYSITITITAKIISAQWMRLSQILLVLCIVLGMCIYEPMSLYHTLFSYSIVNFIIDNLVYVVAILLLYFIQPSTATEITTRKEVSFLMLFIVLGSTMMMSSSDLMSMYLSLELQSFALYIVTCLYNDMGSTRASLKYFLLGAVSSAFILLGIALVYSMLGTTNLVEVRDLYSMSLSNRVHIGMLVGTMSILCGFLFKVSAAPFHNWAPDVYSSLPTGITITLMALPKVGLMVFLSHFIPGTQVSTYVLIVAGLSLIVGTVQGLSQTNLKRLLTYSTINHVGFILLALSMMSMNSESYREAMGAFLFYLIQYTLTTLLIFMVIHVYEKTHMKDRIAYVEDIRRMSVHYGLLAFIFILCLFSMSGIPPLLGFYAKIEVLKSMITDNVVLIYMLAISCSVIAASYYMRIMEVLIFDQEKKVPAYPRPMYNVPGLYYLMSMLIAVITFFILDPSILYLWTELASLGVSV